MPEDDELVDAGDSEEAVTPKAMRDPGQPAQREVDEHDLNHIPFRAWCEFCMKGECQHD